MRKKKKKEKYTRKTMDGIKMFKSQFLVGLKEGQTFQNFPQLKQNSNKPKKQLCRITLIVKNQINMAINLFISLAYGSHETLKNICVLNNTP